MVARYEYRSLDQSHWELRLLELRPKNESLSRIRPACRIFHARLDQNPNFVALSYVWGNPNEARIIIVDKHPFRITLNLYNAILAIRLHKQSLVIWIDSICINQSDTEEKSWQVGLMGDIYRQAERAIAWLGPADDSSDSVMDYLNDFGERADACCLAMGPQMVVPLWKAMVSDHSALQQFLGIFPFAWQEITSAKNLLHSIDGWHDQDKLIPMAGLKSVFHRPWWSRVWVLQEIALPQHAEFVCGTKRISRQRFSAAFNAYYAFAEVLIFKSHQGKDLTEYDSEVLLSMASHRTKLMLSAWRIHFPLLALLRATNVESVHLLGQQGYQHLESTDPRDKIFALLGLAKDREDLERRGVFPDYKKSKEAVIVAVTAALLQQGHISLLSFCRIPEAPLDLPYWVPDWSRPLRRHIQDVEPDHMTLTPRFNASVQQKDSKSITILKQGGVIEGISVQCHVYDKIYEVGVVDRVPVTGTCITDLDWLYEILRLTYKRTIAYVDFYHRLCAVVRTSTEGMTFGNDEFLERVTDDCLDAHCRDALRCLQRDMHSIKQRSIRFELKKYLRAKKTAKSEDRKGASLGKEYMRMTPRKSPFVTEKGHIGIGSWHVKRDDIVVLIHGAQVPFILRRQVDGKYIIVSEAYVDGIMDGEAAENAVWKSFKFV